MFTRRIFVLLLACVLLILASGCYDNEPSPQPTMSNIWPHTDGNEWHYEGTFSDYQATLPLSSDSWASKDLPTMEELHAELQQPLPESTNYTVDCEYLMAFDGMVTTQTGVTAQYIVETFTATPADNKAGQSIKTSVAPDRLLHMIAQARPDLRTVIANRLKYAFKDELGLRAPVLMGGYAFAFEDSGYYSYGDWNTIHSWKYLESSLRTGTEFSMQLAPGLVNDMWLYGRIWSKGNLSVNGRQFKNVIECMYVIDLGEMAVIDEDGSFLGYYNGHVYGTVHYAPDVGPIRVRQRTRVVGNTAYHGASTPMLTEYFLELTDVSLTSDSDKSYAKSPTSSFPDGISIVNP